MKLHQALCIVFMVLPVSVTAQGVLTQRPLIVVADDGGVSAQPYYEELGLRAEPQVSQAHSLPLAVSGAQISPVTDGQMLPVRSPNLSPGMVSPRMVQAPGLMPFFLVGDDDLSRGWLVYRKDALLQLNAVGMVVNVESPQGLQQLRALVPELTLVPVSGVDIANRLGLQHYPVLITSTAIEQ